MVAVVDIDGMQRAVDRLANLQPVPALGMTDELHDEIHEAITKGVAVIEAGGPFQSDLLWMQEHGFRPSGKLILACGYQAERVLIQSWVERARIQAMFDGIDHLVTVVE